MFVIPLPRDIKMGSFNAELKEKTERSMSILQTMSHVIPHMEVLNLIFLRAGDVSGCYVK